MSTLTSAPADAFDLAGALRVFRDHLASPDTALAALRLPDGGWLVLDDAAPELRGDAGEVPQ